MMRPQIRELFSNLMYKFLSSQRGYSKYCNNNSRCFIKYRLLRTYRPFPVFVPTALLKQLMAHLGEIRQ